MLRSLGITLLFALSAFVATTQLSAQDMPRTVVGNAGTYYDNLLFGDLHFTVGEVAVSNLRNQNGQVAEGFHRGYFDLIVHTDEPIPADWQVQVYPNPTADYLRVEVPPTADVQLQLFSPLGQLLQRAESVDATHQVDMSSLPAGSYWLRLLDADGRTAAFQIQKISR